MNILAIDGSTSHTGYCLANQTEYIKSGEYTPQGDNAEMRTKDYMCWLQGICQVENIDIVFYERPSGNRGNMMTNLVLGGLRFSTWLVCDSLDIEFIELAPGQVKGTGIAKVYNVKTRTINTERFATACQYELFEIIAKTNGTINGAAMRRQDDIIDAIGVWQAGLHKSNWKQEKENEI